MNHILSFVVAISLLFVTAGSDAQQLPDPSGEDPAQLRMAESTGLRVYRHDRAAALATDALRGNRKFRKDKRVGSWITEARESSVLVSFVDKDDPDRARLLYQVDVSDGSDGAGKVTAFEPPEAATASQRNAARARGTAAAFDFKPCAQHYNTVVLPAIAGDASGWNVFLLPSTTDAAVIPFGGTYRLELDGEGRTVTSSRTYTRTCIDFARSKRRGAEEAALVVTHLLDPVPTEAHVLLNLQIGTPVVVLTASNRSSWMIDKGRIRFLEKIEPKPGEGPKVPIADVR
ncbi:hypothetical protein [Tahibacter caeni]|uniref:hypothetical protein n=1 Tax=Tahibacter caeni TaxID=1453545 RepID=UPI002147CF9B|nr:hypothetical protein [Tahibacter caeni]